MTSPIQFPTHVIGLMSGTSADGVDAALLFTDGREIAEPRGHVFVEYPDALRTDILALMRGSGNEKQIEQSITELQARAVGQLIENVSQNVPRETIALIGFHGQTIWHKPEIGKTRQLGDGALMARLTGIPTINDFRSNDMKHGGQGAPFAPAYHAALASKLEKPVLVVNIGGVSNVTYIGENNDLLAFDVGPGNALLDDWMTKHTGARYDKNGETAACGRVDEAAVNAFMTHAFFQLLPPKSLDRNAFAVNLDHLSTEDGAATLCAITAATIAHAMSQLPRRPEQLLITGGGRHNPTLMDMISQRSGYEAEPVEAVGWNGDMIEAEAFAYLAARSAQGLPLSWPGTTRVSQSVTGGVFYPA